MLKRKIYITLGLVFAATIAVNAQVEKWQKGIVKQEYLYETAPFPSCHSATIVETPTGLVASFFGGTKERDPDVEIYISRFVDGKWLAPVSAA
ncbi:MAG: sialidase, partial [Pedobacter sp.]